jgi:hypothetical protein
MPNFLKRVANIFVPEEYGSGHRVNIGVRSLKFIWAPCAQLYLLAEIPPPPYTRALLVSQVRRHLFVTPASNIQ